MENLFRNSMFGFNKHDVNEFILKQSKKSESEIKEKNDAIFELEKRISELESKISVLENKSSQSDEASELNSSLLSSAKLIKDRLIDSVEEKMTEISSKKIKASENDKKLQSISEISDKAKTVLDKAEKFDALSKVINGMVGSEFDESLSKEAVKLNFEIIDMSFYKTISDEEMYISEIKNKIISLSEILEKIKY